MKVILKFLVLVLIANSIHAQTFTGKPIYNILTKRAGVTIGTTTVELFPNIAPLHVKNFDSLVNIQFYDSSAFHRVIPGFMIQGGDPNSKHGPKPTWGQGNPNQPTVNAEFSAAKHKRGILSAARDSSINSATSQFFICVATASWLDGKYSVYGKVTSGMNFVDTIVSAPRDSNDNPLQKIEMFITRNGSNDTIPNAPILKSPTSGSASTSTARSLQWYLVNDAIIYHVEIATDSLFTSIFKLQDVGANALTVSGLTQGTTYYWRVRTNNGGHFSNYTPVWNFKVSAVGIDSYSNENKVNVSPNPSKGHFLFTNLERESILKIYDITGKIIFQSVINNTSLNIDLSEKTKGIYFYKIVNGKSINVNGKIIIE